MITTWKIAVWVVFLLGLASISCVYSVSDEEYFLRGCAAYQKQEYNKAYEAYQAIQHKGGAVWYNLGHCAYYLQQYIYARACWLKAYHSDPCRWHDRVDHALKVLARQCNEPAYVAGITWYYRFLCIPLLLLQLFFLAAWYMVGFLLLYRKVRVGVHVGIGVLLSSVVLSGGAVGVHYLHAKRQGALVLEEALLRTGPDEKLPSCAVLTPGQEVTIKEHRVGWYKVNNDAQIGWVSESYLMPL